MGKCSLDRKPCKVSINFSSENHVYSSFFINVLFDRYVNLIFLLNFVFSWYFIISSTKALAK